jgi:hypothetical protein
MRRSCEEQKPASFAANVVLSDRSTAGLILDTREASAGFISHTKWRE